jgi:hypothetical protein
MPIIQALGSSSAQGFGSFGIGTRTQGPTTIGEFWQGGYYAGKIAFGGNTYYLLVSPKASGQNSGINYKTSDTSDSLGLSSYDGATNTAELDSATYPAAQWCAALTINGYSDWYLPALYELEICYYNLKPTTGSNSTSYGTNSYSVPSRGSNYTTGTPAQTSVAAFQSGGSEAFATNLRTWTSTNPGSGLTTATRIDFLDGSQFNNAKTQSLIVRAIRKVAV